MVLKGIKKKKTREIIFFRSGKNSILKGIEKQEKGVMIQAVEDLLNLIEISVESTTSPKKTQKHPNFIEKNFQLLASVYCIYKNDVFDLLSKQKIIVCFGNHFY